MSSKSIAEIDPNFALKSTINGIDLRSYNVKNKPFRMYGLLNAEDGKPFLRIPMEIAKATNEGVEVHTASTAGGRLRFSTNSKHISIRAEMPGKSLMPQMPFAGSAGFDIYENEGRNSRYVASFLPPIDRTDFYESVATLPDNRMRNFTINFPLYDSVVNLSVGVDEGAILQEAPEYTYTNPIVFYGSSITQGGCVSRPGNTYQSMISRRFDCDFVNLGWAGSARGEQAIADYIANLKMSLFFLAYDHNAPTIADFEKTHENFFLTIREKNSALPIIMASKTDIPRSPAMAEDTKKRADIVYRTYENALKRGDKNVYFINGGEVFSTIEHLGVSADSCTVDGCHPNDLGAAAIANVFGNKIKEVLKY